MKTISKYIFLLFAFVLIYGNLAYAVDYNRSGKFPPVKMTYDDLRIFLQRIHKNIPSSETQSDNRYKTNTLTISDGKIQIDIDITDDWDINNIGRLPKVAFDLRYEWRSSQNKIKNIQISFSDYRREISVQGTDLDQVDSVYDSLAGIINEHTCWVGGSLFRALGGGFLILIGVILFNLTAAPFNPPLSRSRIIIILCLGVMIVATTVTLPYDKWFPGFAIYAGTLSFAERYAPQITLIGLLLAIIGIILGLIPILHSPRPKSRKK